MLRPLVRCFGPTHARVGRLRHVGLLVLAVGLGTGSSLSGLATAAAAPGLTFVIDSTADAVDAHLGDGQCRTSTGRCTLRAAIQEANVHAGADVISLPAGTYRLTIAGTDEDQAATGDLDIHDSLTIAGAGAAGTIVDGGGLDRVLHVFAPAVVQVSGLTIRGGAAANGGGGIFSSGELRLLSSTVSGNTAVVAGGGIYNDGGSVTLDSVTVSHNQTTPVDDDSDSSGGGLFSSSARPLVLTNVTFEGNSTSSTGFIQNGAGGGIASGGGGPVTLDGGTFIGNSTPGSGGGLAADDLTVNNASFVGNRASSGSSFTNNPGGGIAAGHLIVRNSRFEGNFGSGGGGLAASDATLTNVLVSGNSAESEQEDCGGAEGGGLRLEHGVLTNVTIAGNSIAGTGGGLSIGSGVLTNVTIANNVAGPHCAPFVDLTDGGGGGGLIGVASLENTILAHNQHRIEPFGPGDVEDNNCGGIFSIDEFTSLGHNLDSDGTCGLNGPGDLRSTDPKLGPLANNGGPTQTLALLAGSPAIDAGANAGCPATDQRGQPRPADGNRDGRALCDIGAFELQPPSDTHPPVTTAAVSPRPNAAGWNRTNVTVTLSATDEAGGSGVKQLTFRASGAQTMASTTVPGATATVPLLTAEGITTLTFFATDRAGNVEASRTVVVKIDRTPPEAALRFDPVRQDLAVAGRDALSGTPSGALAPSSVTPANGERQLRTYAIKDRADNTLLVQVLVKRDDDALRASVAGLQYNGRAAQVPAANRLAFESDVDNGHLQHLEQRIEVARPAQRAEADFDAARNQTRIEVEGPHGEQELTRRGLVLLELLTTTGALSVTF